MAAKMQASKLAVVKQAVVKQAGAKVAKVSKSAVVKQSVLKKAGAKKAADVKKVDEASKSAVVKRAAVKKAAAKKVAVVKQVAVIKKAVVKKAAAKKAAAVKQVAVVKKGKKNSDVAKSVAMKSAAGLRKAVATALSAAAPTPSYVASSPMKNVRLSATRPITVASSCTGLATEEFALRCVLKLPVKHLFMCDSCPHVQKYLWQNFPQVPLLSSVESPEHLAAPRADVYVAGFPCQPFSAAGLNHGMADSRAGPVLSSVLAYIQRRRPTVFVLENVKNLLSAKHAQAGPRAHGTICGPGRPPQAVGQLAPPKAFVAAPRF